VIFNTVFVVGNANCEKEFTATVIHWQITLAVDSCVAIFSACNYSYFKYMRQFCCLHYTLACSLFS
jgi:hypothetical protein